METPVSAETQEEGVNEPVSVKKGNFLPLTILEILTEVFDPFQITAFALTTIFVLNVVYRSYIEPLKIKSDFTSDPKRFFDELKSTFTTEYLPALTLKASKENNPFPELPKVDDTKEVKSDNVIHELKDNGNLASVQPGSGSSASKVRPSSEDELVQKDGKVFVFKNPPGYPWTTSFKELQARRCRLSRPEAFFFVANRFGDFLVRRVPGVFNEKQSLPTFDEFTEDGDENVLDKDAALYRSEVIEEIYRQGSERIRVRFRRFYLLPKMSRVESEELWNREVDAKDKTAYLACVQTILDDHFFVDYYDPWKVRVDQDGFVRNVWRASEPDVVGRDRAQRKVLFGNKVYDIFLDFPISTKKV